MWGLRREVIEGRACVPRVGSVVEQDVAYRRYVVVDGMGVPVGPVQVFLRGLALDDKIATKKRTTIGPDGTPVEVASPRLNAKDELIRVRAFYLDIAHWAAEDPARWAPWVVPCPISDVEISKAKDRKHRKARMDQRTRERLPVLPVLADAVDRRRRASAELLAAAEHTRPGELIPDTAGALRRAVAPKAAGHLTWAEETSTGRRRNLTYEETESPGAWG